MGDTNDKSKEDTSNREYHGRRKIDREGSSLKGHTAAPDIQQAGSAESDSAISSYQRDQEERSRQFREDSQAAKTDAERALILQRYQSDAFSHSHDELERREAAARKKSEEERIARLKQKKHARKEFNYHLAKRFLGICGLRRWEARFDRRREERYQRCFDALASAVITSAKRRLTKRRRSPSRRLDRPLLLHRLSTYWSIWDLYLRRDMRTLSEIRECLQTLIGLAEFHLWEPNIVFKITLASTVLGQDHGILACVRTILSMQEDTYITNHTGKVKSLNGRARKACITICETSALSAGRGVTHAAGLLVYCVQHNINSWEQQATALARLLSAENGLTGLSCVVIVMPLTLKVGEPFCIHDKPIVEETIASGEMVIELLRLQQYMNKGYNIEVLGIAAGENVNDKLCEYLHRTASLAPLSHLLASIRPSELIRRAADTTTQKAEQAENMKDMCNALFAQSQLNVHWPPHESADKNGVVESAACCMSMEGAAHIYSFWNESERMATIRECFDREITNTNALTVHQMLRQADRNMMDAVGTYGSVVAMTPDFVAAMKDLATKEERRKSEIEKELERSMIERELERVRSTTGGRGNLSSLEYVRNPVYTPPMEPKVDAAELLLKEMKDLAAEKKKKRAALTANVERVQRDLDSLARSKQLHK